MRVYVDGLEGFASACKAMRFSFGSEPKSIDKIVSKGYTLIKDDLDLMLKLVVAGDSHSKIMRMVQVWFDMELPRYLWQELDQYRVGTTSMSASTAHTLMKEIKAGKLSIDSFEHTEGNKDSLLWIMDELEEMVLNKGASLEEIKQVLPESFLQRRVVNMNYQTLRHIYFDRRNHRLKSWHVLLDEILKEIPFPELVTKEKE